MSRTTGSDRPPFGAPGKIELVARTGEPAPDLGDAKFDFFHDYGINDRGEITFRAETRIGDATEVGSAIYAGRPDRIELIAADGQQAPGTEGDVTFWYFHDPVINRDGQVAFFATLRGPDARGESDYGLFATGHEGDLRLIARYGDQFELAPGDVRTIEALSHAGVHGTHIVTFNERSDLSMLVRFTDGSEGIFTARVLPEPAAAWLCLIAIATGTRLRRVTPGTGRAPSPRWSCAAKSACPLAHVPLLTPQCSPAGCLDVPRQSWEGTRPY